MGKNNRAPAAAPEKKVIEPDAAPEKKEGDDVAPEQIDGDVGAGNAGGSDVADESSSREEEGSGDDDEGGTPDTDMDDDADEDKATGGDSDELATALASAITASEKPAVPVNDIPAVVEPVVVAAVVSDIPESAPVAPPVDRQPSVSLPLAPVTVRAAKATPSEIKFQLISDRLEEYAKSMAPNVAVSSLVGKTQQVQLYRTIEQVLKLEGAEFLRGFTMLLDFVNAHRTAHFSDKYIYRFFGEMSLNAADRKNFNRLLHLFVATCDRPTRRMGLAQIDLNHILGDIRNSAVQQRITEFYQI